MKRKRPILKFALTLGTAIAFVAMTTFILVSNLSPIMQNRADVQGLFILADAFFALVLGCAIWASFRSQDRKLADDRWYSQRQYLARDEKVD